MKNKSPKAPFQLNNWFIRWSKMYEKWDVTFRGRIYEQFKLKSKAIKFAKNTKVPKY
jgi:hypothetical protein